MQQLPYIRNIKKKKNEYGEIVDRSTTKASDERTLKISEIILQCIQRKGYCTEKEVVYILGSIQIRSY